MARFVRGYGPAMDATPILDCMRACTTCADACLAEEDLTSLRDCIRTDLDCADVCLATARVVARGTPGGLAVLRAQLEACAVACGICADECERHAEHHDHCRACAEACRRSAEACQAMLRELAVPRDAQ